jgi:DNA-directed RNA polymerase specialized sigma24 family protein
MRRLIYDMYYADEITQDVAIKLLDKLEQIRNKKRY